MLWRYRARTTDFFFIGNGMSIGISWMLLPTKARPSLRSIFDHSLVSELRYDIGTKPHCIVRHESESIATKVCSQIGSKWNATCPRKGRMLRFESNSTATSDGSAQKLGNDVRHDYESTSAKVCSQIGRKWNAMFESHVVTSVDRWSFYFGF